MDKIILFCHTHYFLLMANVVTLIPYNVFPAKLGGQKGIACFYKFFSKYHNLTCITVNKNDPSFAEYKVLNILSNSKFRYINIAYFFKLQKILKEFQINDLIIEHPYFGWLGIFLKMTLPIKLIVHSHNIESLRFKSIGKWWWSILWYYEKWVHSHADCTFCKTEEDRNFFINEYKIKPDRCHVITYGIEWDKIPSKLDIQNARDRIINTYNLQDDTLLFLFNGTLSYPPNLKAVNNILNDINPLLLKSLNNYKIIICGKGLPDSMNQLKEYSAENIIYAGFVEDIDLFFRGVDVFINPVIDGGGIKTKLVEALGSNLDAVSCKSGAIGISEKICNGKLHITLDEDWNTFASKMTNSKNEQSNIKQEFFAHFYWDNIAKKAASLID